MRFSKIRAFCSFRKYHLELDELTVESVSDQGEILTKSSSGELVRFKVDDGILQRLPKQTGTLLDYKDCGDTWSYLPVLELT